MPSNGNDSEKKSSDSKKKKKRILIRELKTSKALQKEIVGKLTVQFGVNEGTPEPEQV